MSDFTYRWATRICRPAFSVSSRPVVLHVDRAALTGGYILAPTHLSIFDAPLLIAHAPRHIDFMAAAEARGHPLWNAFLRQFNTFYVQRQRRDPGAVRAAVRRLRQGRVIGLFPEGAVRAGRDSVLGKGALHPGIARLAQLADVPVLPCVVLGAAQYDSARNWLPLRRTRYGVIFGHSLRVNPAAGDAGARQGLIDALSNAYAELSGELTRQMAQ